MLYMTDNIWAPHVRLAVDRPQPEMALWVGSAVVRSAPEAALAWPGRRVAESATAPDADGASGCFRYQ